MEVFCGNWEEYAHLLSPVKSEAFSMAVFLLSLQCTLPQCWGLSPKFACKAWKKSDSKLFLPLLLGGSFNPASLLQIAFLVSKYEHCWLKITVLLSLLPSLQKKVEWCMKNNWVPHFSCITEKIMASCGTFHTCLYFEMPLFKYDSWLIQNHVMTAFH